MSAQIDQIAETYRDALRRMVTLNDRIDDDTFNAKPSPTSWSVGECLVHLNTMSKGYIPAFEAALEDGAPRATGPFKWGFISRKFIDAVRPGSRAMSTAGVMKPPSTQGTQSAVDRDRVMSRFEADMKRYIEIVERADGFDLSRIRVSSPFLKILRLPLGALLEGLGLHAQRHIGQAERAVAQYQG